MPYPFEIRHKRRTPARFLGNDVFNTLNRELDGYEFPPDELSRTCGRLLLIELNRIINAPEYLVGIELHSELPKDLQHLSAHMGKAGFMNCAWMISDSEHDIEIIAEKFCKRNVQESLDDIWRISSADWSATFLHTVVPIRVFGDEYDQYTTRARREPTAKLTLYSSKWHTSLSEHELPAIPEFRARMIQHMTLFNVTGDAGRFVQDMSILKLMHS